MSLCLKKLTDAFSSSPQEQGVRYNALLLQRSLLIQGVGEDVCEAVHSDLTAQMKQQNKRLVDSELFHSVLSAHEIGEGLTDEAYDQLKNDPPFMPYGHILMF